METTKITKKTRFFTAEELNYVCSKHECHDCPLAIIETYTIHCLIREMNKKRTLEISKEVLERDKEERRKRNELTPQDFNN